MWVGVIPALWASYLSPQSAFRKASAIWERAELCVQINKTVSMRIPLIEVCEFQNLALAYRCFFFDSVVCRLPSKTAENALIFEPFHCGKHMKLLQPFPRQQ